MGKDLYGDDDDDGGTTPTKKAPSSPPPPPAKAPLWPKPNFSPAPKPPGYTPLGGHPAGTAPAPPSSPPPPSPPPATKKPIDPDDPYADDDRAIPAPSGAPGNVKQVNGKLVLKEPCPRCGDKNAVVLATSVSCPNAKCITNRPRGTRP